MLRCVDVASALTCARGEPPYNDIESIDAGMHVAGHCAVHCDLSMRALRPVLITVIRAIVMLRCDVDDAATQMQVQPK